MRTAIQPRLLAIFHTLSRLFLFSSAQVDCVFLCVCFVFTVLATFCALLNTAITVILSNSETIIWDCECERSGLCFYVAFLPKISRYVINLVW